MDRFIDETQTKVSGKVKLKMRRGALSVIGRESAYSLYKNDLATFSTESTFDQGLAKGFVELWGLQSIIANAVATEERIKNEERMS